jgi:hypothetical protein
VLSLSKQGSSSPLSPFIVSPKEQETVASFLADIANKSPERFKRGFVGLEIRERKELNAIAGTDGSGTLYFTPEPARLLASAILKLRKKQTLAFEEEQAFATLEHEILHNEARGFRILSEGKAPSNIMELLNEITARNTYQRHLQRFSVKAEHSETIRTNGNGYPLLVKNFDLLLEKIGISAAPYQEFEKILLNEDYAALFTKTTELLVNLSGVRKEKIQRLLVLLNKEEFPTFLGEILR